MSWLLQSQTLESHVVRKVHKRGQISTGNCSLDIDTPWTPYWQHRCHYRTPQNAFSRAIRLAYWTWTSAALQPNTIKFPIIFSSMARTSCNKTAFHTYPVPGYETPASLSWTLVYLLSYVLPSAPMWLSFQSSNHLTIFVDSQATASINTTHASQFSLLAQEK
jgi:hypothetical protein